MLKSSAANICLTLLANLRTEASNVEQEHIAPIGAVWSWSTLFGLEASKLYKQTTNQRTFVMIGVLRVMFYVSVMQCNTVIKAFGIFPMTLTGYPY